MTFEDEMVEIWKHREELLRWADGNMLEEFRDNIRRIMHEIHSNWTYRMTFGAYPRDKEELYRHIFLRDEVEKRKEELLRLMNKEIFNAGPGLYKRHPSEEINSLLWYEILRGVRFETGIEIVKYEDVLNLPVWSEIYLRMEEGELERMKRQILCELAERGHEEQYKS